MHFLDLNSWPELVVMILGCNKLVAIAYFTCYKNPLDVSPIIKLMPLIFH